MNVFIDAIWYTLKCMVYVFNLDFKCSTKVIQEEESTVITSSNLDSNSDASRLGKGIQQKSEEIQRQKIFLLLLSFRFCNSSGKLPQLTKTQGILKHNINVKYVDLFNIHTRS